MARHKNRLIDLLPDDLAIVTLTKIRESYWRQNGEETFLHYLANNVFQPLNEELYVEAVTDSSIPILVQHVTELVYSEEFRYGKPEIKQINEGYGPLRPGEHFNGKHPLPFISAITASAVREARLEAYKPSITAEPVRRAFNRHNFTTYQNISTAVENAQADNGCTTIDDLFFDPFFLAERVLVGSWKAVSPDILMYSMAQILFLRLQDYLDKNRHSGIIGRIPIYYRWRGAEPVADGSVNLYPQNDHNFKQYRYISATLAIAGTAVGVKHNDSFHES